jgi:osmotically-inducible protein OsmY
LHQNPGDKEFNEGGKHMKAYTYTALAGLVSVGLIAGACGAPEGDRSGLATDPGMTADASDRSDTAIATEIRGRFYGDDLVRGRYLEVHVNDGQVTLEGSAASDDARRRAEQLAEDVDGVRTVQNRLEVNEERQAAASARTDARDDVNAGWITTKIQAQYFMTTDVRARSIDVTTSDTGVVTLAGEVESQESRRRAEEIARQTDGVRQVENQLRVVPDRDADRTADTRAAADADRTDVADRRDGEPVNDGWLTTKIQAKYFLDTDVAGRRIDVDSNNGLVTLTGEVRTEAERRQAVAIARNTDGVRDVTDRLRLVPDLDADEDRREGTTAERRESEQPVEDTWITTKIQSKFFLEGDVKGRDIDVTTRNGVVTLTGNVDSEVAQRTAEAIARETNGVARVVNELRVAPDATDDTN